MDNRGCQSCLARLVGAQVEEGVVHSREEGTDFAEAGTVGGFDQTEKEAVTQAIDMGTPLGCTDRKKAMYPWSWDAVDSGSAWAAQNPGKKP